MIADTHEASKANLHYIFSILPLRDPAQYGLSSTDGIELVARLFATTADVYANAVGDDSDDLKAEWMKAFVDALVFMIEDEGMLKGTNRRRLA